MKRRFLTTLLSAVMALSMLFGTGIMTQAAETDTEYVSLPVTIRDYAADGMLFQWNELGATGNQVVGSSLPTPKVKYTEKAGGGAYNATTGDGYVRYTSTSTGIYITYSVSGGNTRTSMRYGVLKYRTNAAGYSEQPTIGHRWNNGNHYVNLPTGGYNQSDFKSVVVDLGSGSETVSYVTIYPRLASGAHIDIAEIAFFSSKADADNYASGTAAGGQTYHHGSTKGYGLLQTDTKDHFNDLANAAAISGTTLTQNGTWNSADVTTSDTTLNSGAKQTLYGCYVRTDLVEPTLGANGKPVYTEATVTYLANYMQKTLPEVWKNSDGTYNMWYVMGTKLFDNNNNYVGPVTSATKDLASVLRSTITGGLGSYAATKAKTLNQVTDCTTYFDAAYFLLHNTFSDSVGYGQTVNEYHTINLVKKTVDGKTYYVYNSAYDGTVYDTANGVIYNSQTDTITTREGTTYVRGNLQPESRFDPIAALGDGNSYYGKNGDAYAKAIGDTENDKYYNATNYNLTLEGHAQFIYYEDDNLYFNFTGDDDVYLYINGTRVLDMGGAHAISKCGISLNSVKTLCGLKDGEVYTFDFYYMERHGTAANFGIETNIKIVDPSMLTEKTAYQDGQNVGYNGYVNPNKPVTYAFQLTNNGEAQIQNLTFKDDDIGVNLTKDAITLNRETTFNNLVVYVLNPNGTNKVHYTVGEVTEEKLKQVLTDGLLVGESVAIYGFNYTIPEAKWVDNQFPNTVYTTAISTGENASHKNLNGVASCQVQKQTYQYAPLHYYEWKGHGVTATKAELIQPVLDAVSNSGISADSADIKLCSASGQISDAGINSKAQVTSEGILYTGTATGSDTYYYMVGNYGPIAVTVYSYDVADNTYVLDYGLAVELNGPDFGLRVNDTLKLSVNPFVTTDYITKIENPTTNYGYFTFDGETTSLTYTPNKIIDNTDSVEVIVRVIEANAEELTTTTGVEMRQTVTTAPASVVYYEDDFPGITYCDNTNGNDWVQYETVDENGDSVAGTEQSADQDMNYGSDPNYAQDKTGTLQETDFVLATDDLDAIQQQGIEDLNAYLGLGGTDSNGTVKKLTVQKTDDVMSFTFTGTGFEIVSRTTADQYAVVSVRVEKSNGDVVKQFPVITESKGGTLYQVPIISVTGLTRDTYTVTLKAAGSTAAKTRVLYIDGIRIYGPLSNDEALQYYNPEEYKASFFEIKKLIQEGKTIYADDSDTDGIVEFVSGATLVEDVNANNVLITIDSVNGYMKVGPNNEIYLDGNAATGVIVFYLTPEESVPEGARTIQVGAHRKVDSMYDDTGSVSMVYGSSAEAILEEEHLYTVASGTEQYYTIDVNDLVKDSDGRYLVLIGTTGSENYGTTLALTSLKLSGYTISYAEKEIQAASENGILSESPVVQAVQAVYSDRLRKTQQQVPEETTEQVPEDATEEIPEDATEEIPEDATEEIP
ncbi:MAG: fibro-slime domain-containing protein, partial [Faecousia sp.]